MATIHVDGKEYEVDGAQNLLEACLSLGLDIPYFCWHPALGSVGSCRQCAVIQYQNPDDKRGRLVMSCMTPATDGTYISIEDDEAKHFREAVLEFLMLNHPHDCPVCAEGGNCHLQDMTQMTGHSFRKYRFNKRTHNNQDLGPFINHEMNRCIACYRCVRYYKDYAGGTDLGVFGAHDNVYFGRAEDGVLESEFSGNLVEVCPTGVFTDKTHAARYNRKWDMQFAPSICQQCSLGCNISPGERYGELRRIENRYNGQINHYFLCDRGRFGYGYVNLKDRPRQPKVKQGDAWKILDDKQAAAELAQRLASAQGIIGIGSSRASIESNFALRQFVGEANFSTGMSAAEQQRLTLMIDVLSHSGIKTPSLRDIERYDAVIVLGEDVTQTGARIALAIRQALKGKAKEMAAAQKVADWQIAAVQNIGQHARHPLFVSHVDKTRLDDVAAWNYIAPVAEQATFGFAVAHAIDETAPGVDNLSSDLQQKVAIIASALRDAKRPLIVTGSQAGSDAIIEAATNIATALKKQGSDVGITFVAAHANSMGVAMMGGQSIEQALNQLVQEQVDTVIIMENDLYRHTDAALVDAALSKAKNVIVMDHQQTAIMQYADMTISAASFAEGDGTLINQEGRAQRFFQVYDPAYYDNRPKDEHGQLIAELDTSDRRSFMFESWRWLEKFSAACSQPHAWSTLDKIVADCAATLPQFAAIVDAAPSANFRVKGMKIARQPNRYSGRTSMLAHQNVHEPAQPEDKDSSLAFSMEGYSGTELPRQQIPFAQAPGWNSPQAWNKFQSEVGGDLKAGDPGVRLFEPADETLSYFAAPQTTTAATLTVAPCFALFGSEELSQRSKVIQKRMAPAHVLLSQQDAQRLKLTKATTVAVTIGETVITLPLQVSETLAVGQVGLPVGYPQISPTLVGRVVEHIEEVTL